MALHRALTLVVAALSLAMTFAHVLEMPQKLSYGAEMYAAVNRTLYRYFAIGGGVLEIAAIILVGSLAYRERLEPDGAWRYAAVAGYALSFVSWLVLVMPVNRAAAAGQRWVDLRIRWELGHLVGFVLALAGFIALAGDVVRRR